MGAGSVGILASAFLAKQQDSVVLHEGSKTLGGITRDILDSRGRLFFAGCQYLEASILPEEYDYSGLRTFRHRYGSVTETSSESFFKSDFAGPAFRDDWFEMDHESRFSAREKVEGESIRDRFRLYPPRIGQELQSYASRLIPLNALEILDSDSIGTLGLARVTSWGNDSKLLESKLSNATADRIYGVTRQTLGRPHETALVPTLGYNHFWNIFCNQIATRTRLDIRFGTKVNRESALSEISQGNYTTKIWTADPRFPTRHFSGKKLESYCYKKYIVGISVDEVCGLDLPYYLNVFSSSNSILRIYVYELESEVRASIELSRPPENLKSLRMEVARALNSSTISLKIRDQGFTCNELRQYFPHTIFDAALLKFTSEQMKKSGWISEAIEHSDRSSRLQSILKVCKVSEISANVEKISASGEPNP